jgi:hypothetical protein
MRSRRRSACRATGSPGSFGPGAQSPPTRRCGSSGTLCKSGSARRLPTSKGKTTPALVLNGSTERSTHRHRIFQRKRERGTGMATSASISAERLADHFVNYLFDTYQGTRHVRRVATWIGFLFKSVENLPGAHLEQRRQRQVSFDYAGHRFKARYNHKAGTRSSQIIRVEVWAERVTRNTDRPNVLALSGSQPRCFRYCATKSQSTRST